MFLLLKECAVFKSQPASAKGRNSICISRIYMFAGKLISQLQRERERECGIGKTTSFSHIHFSRNATRRPFLLLLLPHAISQTQSLSSEHSLPSSLFYSSSSQLVSLSRETSKLSSSSAAKGRGGKREIWRWHVFASPSSPSFSNPNPRLYSSSFSFSSFPVTLRPCHRQSHKKGAGNGQELFFLKSRIMKM